MLRLLLLLVALPLTSPVSATSAIDWLNKMSDSMQNKSYSGIYVYLHGDRVETLQVSHLRDANGERERLFSLNGEAREVFRDNRNVVCVWPGSKSVFVSKSRPRTPFSEWTEGNIGDIENWYDVSLLGEDRVAGRSAVIVGITPKDTFRYAHKLWVDSENALLLRSQMLGLNGVPVEQVMFTQMSLNDEIPVEELIPSLSRDGYTLTEQDSSSEGELTYPATWAFTELPQGFKQIAENLKAIPGNPYSTHHVTLSDGLASVSVYVEKHGKDDGSRHGGALLGESRMGAVSAFGLNINKFHIMVVGEVPMETATRIGRSIKLAAISQ